MAQRVIIFAGTPADPVPITVIDPLPVLIPSAIDVTVVGGATGQALMALSAPVVIAADQSPIPVSFSGGVAATQSGPWIVGATQSGVWGVAQSGVWTVGVAGTVPISVVTLPLPAGAATEATLALRLTEATFTTRTPVIGQAAMSASSPVVIASNQSSIPTNKAASYLRLNVAGTTVIKASPGVLHKITINDFGSGTMTFYDNTAGSGTVIAAIKPAGNTGTLFYELSFTIGLTAVIVGASPGDITVTYD